MAEKAIPIDTVTLNFDACKWRTCWNLVDVLTFCKNNSNALIFSQLTDSKMHGSSVLYVKPEQEKIITEINHNLLGMGVLKDDSHKLHLTCTV